MNADTEHKRLLESENSFKPKLATSRLEDAGLSKSFRSAANNASPNHRSVSTAARASTTQGPRWVNTSKVRTGSVQLSGNCLLPSRQGGGRCGQPLAEQQREILAEHSRDLFKVLAVSRRMPDDEMKETVTEMKRKAKAGALIRSVWKRARINLSDPSDPKRLSLVNKGMFYNLDKEHVKAIGLDNLKESYTQLENGVKTILSQTFDIAEHSNDSQGSKKGKHDSPFKKRSPLRKTDIASPQKLTNNNISGNKIQLFRSVSNDSVSKNSCEASLEEPKIVCERPNLKWKWGFQLSADAGKEITKANLESEAVRRSDHKRTQILENRRAQNTLRASSHLSFLGPNWVSNQRLDPEDNLSKEEWRATKRNFLIS